MTKYMHKWGDIPRNPSRIYTINGVKVTATDLLRVGEMLEAERVLGTFKAAKLFQPNPGGKYTWGIDGKGDIALPLHNGKHVDIDWLNTLISFGALSEADYAAGKLAWTVADGLKILFTEGSFRGFKGHWNSFFSAEEPECCNNGPANCGSGAQIS